MKPGHNHDLDLQRRAFLRQSGATALAVVFAFMVWPATGAIADDNESDGADDSSDDGSDSGDDGGGDIGSGDDGIDAVNSAEENQGSGRGSLGPSEAVRAVERGEAIPLKIALKRVVDRYGGSVIGVTLKSTGRRLEYNFKVRTDRGAVRSIRMDARTGRFLGLGALFR